MTICRLPHELLQLAFSHYIGGSSNDFRPAPRYDNRVICSRRRTHRNSSCTPFHLALVCRQWYSLVVGNPDLWANIHIRRPQPHDVPIFKLWLQRSRNQLLTLSIHEEFSSAPPFPSDIPTRSGNFDSDPLSQQKQPLLDIIDLAIGVSERWKLINISLSEDVGRVFQEEEFEERDFPNLESFVIDMRETGTSTWGDPSRCTPIHALGQRLCTSTRLRSAKWESYIDEDMRAYVPFDRLTSLSLATVTDSEAIIILSDCQELIGLEVRHYRASRQPEEHIGSKIGLPKLQVASLGFLEELTSVPPFFTKFDAPALQELHLKRGFGRSTTNLRVIGSGGLGLGDEKGWKGLIAFLERSGCKLKKLAYCPDVELSQLEADTMGEHLKNEVFSDLIESPRRHKGNRGISSCDGLEGCQ